MLCNTSNKKYFLNYKKKNTIFKYICYLTNKYIFLYSSTKKILKYNIFAIKIRHLPDFNKNRKFDFVEKKDPFMKFKVNNQNVPNAK